MGTDTAQKLYDQSPPEKPKTETSGKTPLAGGEGVSAPKAPIEAHANGELEFVEQFGDKLFQGDTNPHGTFQRNFAELRDTPGLAGKTKEVGAVFQESAKFFHNHGFNPDEASEFQSAILQTIRQPPDGEKFARWETEAYESLRAKYPHDFEKRVDLAKRYVNTLPGLRKILHETGAGSNPRIVEMLVDKAWSLRSSGRLRAKGKGK